MHHNFLQKITRKLTKFFRKMQHEINIIFNSLGLFIRKITQNQKLYRNCLKDEKAGK